MLLIVADFMPKSAIFDSLPQFRPPRPSGRRAEKLLTVADFAYEVDHCRIGGISPAASYPTTGGRNRSGRSWPPCLPASLADRPADGLIRKIAGPRRPAITPG